MDDSAKLTRSQREKIIFRYLKGEPDPLYEVQETKNGKYIVRPKQIELEEEAINEKPEELSSEEEEEPPRKQYKRTTLKGKKRSKQDAKRIIEALTNIINSNDYSDDYSDDIQRAPPLIEPTNFNPQPQLSFRRRQLRF